MLLFNSNLLFSDPFRFFVDVVAVSTALLVGITFHEFAHAYAANRQGDLTATRMGRLTLNPKAHLDRAGTLMLLIAGFGWGKPVPVNPYALRSGRRGMAIVSVAGPVANLLLVVAFALLFQLSVLEANVSLTLGGLQIGVSLTALRALDVTAWVTIIATYSVILNLILAVFNLLPIPPLDGGGILAGIAPRRWLPAVAKLQRIGPIALIVVIASSLLGVFSPLAYVFGPVLRLAHALLSA